MIYTNKQLQLMKLWKENRLKRINLLEGSVRSGKTWISLVLWAFWVASRPKEHSYLMTAKNLTALKRNCLELLHELVGDYFKYSLSKKEGELFGRRIYLEGANDARAESKIRGMTLGGAYCDELAQMPEDFFAMLLSRLSAPGAKLIATTNPDNPNHWLMQNYIRRQDELNMMTMRFLLDDNTTLDREYVESLKKEYTGVFYDRFILGLWKAAEGVIYRQFADDPDKWLIDKPTEDIDFISIGVDFGGNRSLTTFVATAVHYGYKKLTVVDDYHIEGAKGEIDSDRVNREFISFVNNLKLKYPFADIRYCFADCEAQYLIAGLQKASKQAGLGLRIGDCEKVKILQRIYCTNSLLNTNRLYILRDCKLLIQGLQNALWDSKKPDTRLDDFSSDIDILDAFEYSFERFILKLTPTAKGID